MKIKQITSLILMLTMLVLSTSCGKSTSVNPNLPTPKSQAANLNQDLIPEESFSIYKWVKNHLLWTATAAIGATYVGLNEWRHYSERKAIKDIDIMAQRAETKADNALHSSTNSVNTANQAYGLANSLTNKINAADTHANTAKSWAREIRDKFNAHIKKPAHSVK